MNCMIRRQNHVSPVTVFESFFNDPLFATFPVARGEGNALPLDISETDSHVIVRASVPGLRKDQIEAEVHEGVLSITATQTEAVEESGEHFLRRERQTRTLSRRVALHTPVQEDQAQAELADGVLTLRLPKVAKDQPRKIRIG